MTMSYWEKKKLEEETLSLLEDKQLVELFDTLSTFQNISSLTKTLLLTLAITHQLLLY